MGYAYLAVSILGALIVLSVWFPIKKEPFADTSFLIAFVPAEAPLQTIAWQVIATVIFGIFGAFSHSWPGWAGLVIAVASWLGLFAMAISGARSKIAIDRALLEINGVMWETLPLVPHPNSAPMWGKWWKTMLAFPIKGKTTEVIRDLDYFGDGIVRHRLDVYRPKAKVEKAPVFIYVHGGAWTIGDKRQQGRSLLYELCARGWVCVTPNYRLSPKGTWPDHIIDVKRAIAWVHQNIADYGGDSNFVAIGGGSAGGQLAALAALTPFDKSFQPGFETLDTSVSACAPFYGEMDMTGSKTGSGAYGPGLLKILEEKVMKTKISEHREIFEAASPTMRVHKDAPPFFVFHGTFDTLIPLVVADQFVEALRAVSTQPVGYGVIPHAQHAYEVMASFRSMASVAGAVSFLEGVRSHKNPLSKGSLPAMSVKGISVRFGGVSALTEVTLSVAAGAITGLIGPNGAGKTTLFNVMTGLCHPDRGRVYLADLDVTDFSPHRRARLGLSRTFQRLELFSTLSARDNVRVGFEATGMKSKLAAKRAEALLQRIGIGHVGNIGVGALPTGTARLVELARALAIDPKILLLDEPCSGLNEIETEALGRVLSDLAGDGKAIVLVEHDMDLVMDICDTIYVLDFGSIVAHGNPREIRENKAVQTAYLGVGVK